MVPSSRSNGTLDSDLVVNLTVASVSNLRGGKYFPSLSNSSEMNDYNQTMSILDVLTTGRQPSLTTPSGHLETYEDDSSIVAKISLLLVVTAVVLIASYKFVVRLFLGYADRKDEVVPDGWSDDEDSAVVKRVLGPNLDIG